MLPDVVEEDEDEEGGGRGGRRRALLADRKVRSTAQVTVGGSQRLSLLGGGRRTHDTRQLGWKRQGRDCRAGVLGLEAYDGRALGDGGETTSAIMLFG